MWYIYHIVPDNFTGDTLYPLRILQEKYPQDERYTKKYTDRPHIPQLYIPQLDCYWPDVIHFGAIHPLVLRQALTDAWFPQDFSYYAIDTDKLDQSKMIVYLNLAKADKNNLIPEDFVAFNTSELSKRSNIPQDTLVYYKKKATEGKSPIPFLFVPHILYKGIISLENIKLQHTKDSIK